jgi:hypothetical protein
MVKRQLPGVVEDVVVTVIVVDEAEAVLFGLNDTVGYTAPDGGGP